MSLLSPQDVDLFQKVFDYVKQEMWPDPDPYLNDPVGWVKEVLKEFLWSKQREIFESIRRNRYTAVMSCHDSGKSHSASRAVCWWQETHEDPFSTTTAPTTKQVHAILWRYIGQAHRKADLSGRITLDDEWYAGPGDKELIGYGRKPADTDQAAFSGIHSLNPFICIDEAGGVPKSIFDAVDTLATNSNARVLAIGNPDDPGSHFAEVCKPGSGWHVIRIDGLLTPNFTEEEVSNYPLLQAYMEAEGIPYSTEEIPADLRPLLISPEWVDERIKRWGTTSPIFTSKVRGQFPDLSDDTLILPKWIKAAQERSLPRSKKPRLGVDIARFGQDETTMYRREGGWVRLHRAHMKLDTMATTGHIIKARDEINVEDGIEAWLEIVVDDVGVGAGVYDRLVEQGVEVVGFNGGVPAYDTERFVNRRAELYWMLRELFERGEIDIDEADDQLASQLGSIKWTVHSRGRIKIESKDDMRKRGMPSPDRADGLLYTLVDAPSIEVEPEDSGVTTIMGDLLSRRF